MRNKKGQIFEQFGSLATGIAALAILLVVAFLVMSQGKEQVVDLISSTTYNNETKTITVDEYTAFINCIPDQAMSLTNVYNDTVSGAIVDPANYTVSGNTVNFSNKANTFTFASIINLTYTCKQPDEAYNSTDTLQNATDDIPTWVPMIVIAFIGAILLGLVALFKRR